MNLLSLILILLLALILVAILEGISKVIFWKPYRFKRSRFWIEYCIGVVAVLLFIYGELIFNPLGAAASRHTFSFFRRTYEQEDNRRAKRIGQFETSETSGYFLFKCKIGEDQFTLRTTYDTSGESPVFKTKRLDDADNK